MTDGCARRHSSRRLQEGLISAEPQFAVDPRETSERPISVGGGGAIECQKVAELSVSSGYAHLGEEGAASFKKPTVSQRDSCCNVRPRQRTIPNLDCHAYRLRRKPLVRISGL